MSKKEQGYTIIVRDKDGKEIERLDGVDQYMIIWEGSKRMDVKAKCIMQWAAYAIRVADNNLNNSLQRTEMQQAAAKQQGVQVATQLPPGFPGSLKQMRN